MKIMFNLMICFSLTSCATIPDISYHKIKCVNEDACDVSELDSYIRNQTFKNIAMKHEWSRRHIDDLKSRGEDRKTPEYKLFYLEYDEKGHKLEDNRQFDLIKRAVETAEKPVYLIVFIHGWHNNASIDRTNRSLDTTGFPYMLAKRKFVHNNMDVIGVYVGWRGEKYKYNPAKNLFIKNRALVADSIGKKGELKEDLIALSNTVQEHSASGHALIMGHSLGGRLLSRVFLDEYSRMNNISDWRLGQRTLLVTLNAAIGADAFDGVISKIPNANERVARPLWINITSKDDTAISKFSYARYIGQNLSDGYSLRKNVSIGNYLPYVSHEFAVIHGIDDNPECDIIDYKIIMENNPLWFKLPEPQDGACGTRHLYEYDSIDLQGKDKHYTTMLKSISNNNRKPLGYMWNFRTDKSVIDYSVEEAKVSKSLGTHNAFVQANLGRMLDDMLFTPPVK